jgi:hypothetical protein
MNRLFLAAVAAPALLAASPALGCSGPGVALIHRSLPANLPEGVIIAEVELELEPIISLTRPGVRARVRRMIQGEPVAMLIVSTVDAIAGCTSAFGNGSSGFIIGVASGYEGDALIVVPQYAPVSDGDHSPNGLRLFDPNR